MTEITNLPYAGAIPFSTATPFTYREGVTNLELIHALKMWAIEVVPDLNRVLGEFWTKYLEDHQAILDDIVETKTQWQTLFDQFMADVVAQLEGLNDQAMANLIRDKLSKTRVALDELFAEHAVIDARDHSSIQAAVNLAYATGRTLMVSDDVTAPSLNRNIHEIDTIGQGSITVNGAKYYVNPRHQGIERNTLYIDPTNGNDAHSGIDPSAPLKTFNRLGIIFTMLGGKLLDGFWDITIKAGTHMMTAGWRMDGLRSKHPINIRGEGTLGTILDGTNDTLGKAFYFKSFYTSVVFENLQIQNYKGKGGEQDIDTNAGILVQGPGHLTVRDCRILHCTTGIHAGYACSASIHRNEFIGSTPRSVDSSIGSGVVILYGSSAQIGSAGNGNTFTNCLNGVHITRNAVAHVDYNTYEGCYRGLQGSHNSRSAVLAGDFNNGVIGIDITGGAECTFNRANFVNNTEHNVKFSGTGRFTQYQGQYPSAAEYRLYGTPHVPPVTSADGLGLKMIHGLPSSANIPAYTLFGMNKKIRFKLAGVLNGAGPRNIRLRKSDRNGANGEYLGTCTIPSSYTGNFTLEWEIQKSAHLGDFRIIMTLCVNNEPVRVQSGYVTELDLTHDWLFRTYVWNDAEGLTVSGISHELFVLG